MKAAAGHTLSAPVQVLKPPHPSIFLLLNLPFGIASGYIIVVIPYLVTHAGLPVATAASMVAAGIAPKFWKVLWSPLVDIGLTLKSWYRIGATLAGVMLIVSSLMPLTRSSVPLIAAALFMAEFGCSLLVPALGGFMAHAMPDDMKGRAAGWYQFGAKLGRAVGGGGGLWLAVHGAKAQIAGLVLGFSCVMCSAGLYFLSEPQRPISGRAIQRVARIGRELWHLVRSRDGLLVVLLSIAPIGVSGADNFFSAIANEWNVPVGTVVLVTGFASGLVAMGGSLLGGWSADRVDRRIVYLATGLLVASSSAALAAAPHSPGVFVPGTLALRFFIGMSDAALSALVLSVIGRSAAATKFSVLGGLGNAPEVYMTVVSGRIHDMWNTSIMLLVESGISIVCLGAAALWLKRYGEARKPLSTVSAASG